MFCFGSNRATPTNQDLGTLASKWFLSKYPTSTPVTFVLECAPCPSPGIHLSIYSMPISSIFRLAGEKEVRLIQFIQSIWCQYCSDEQKLAPNHVFYVWCARYVSVYGARALTDWVPYSVAYIFYRWKRVVKKKLTGKWRNKSTLLNEGNT